MVDTARHNLQRAEVLVGRSLQKFVPNYTTEVDELDELRLLNQFREKQRKKKLAEQAKQHAEPRFKP